MEEEEKERIEELKEQNEGEFTLTRRILALQFLIKAAGKEIRFGEKGVNKTKIAEFIDFLVSKENKPKDIRDTSVHTRLKNIWDKENKAHLENLIYIRKV
ncbi:MAG: hypothetical protein IPP79_24090 [Chitinophagaceae bacterium]|nr:hypothetical protein [Chitinophagaceae bacterium]